MKKRLTIFLFGVLFACSADDRIDDPIPFFHFEDVVINITLPQYQALQIDGGYTVIPTAGLRGVIVYRSNASTFRAFEQNCSFQPQDACATVQPYAIYMQDACCGSIFNYNGDPTGGFAWRPLGQYETRINGPILTITSEVINY